MSDTEGNESVSGLQSTFKEAIRRGYTYDPATGILYGLKGGPLKLTLSGTQRYPTVAVSTPGLGKESHAVPAHRFAAYFIWGDEIFNPALQVRHKNGLYDLRACSIDLGTRQENMADIPAEVRSRAASAGRAAQPNKSKHANPPIPDDTVKFIKNTARRNQQGQLLPMELERLSGATGVRKDVVQSILRGISHQHVK